MKLIINILLGISIMLLPMTINSQSTLQTKNFTGSYTANYAVNHVEEMDAHGNVTKSKSIVTGEGKNSILGKVKVFSVVSIDASSGSNVIDYTLTDMQGNSVYAKAKGTPGQQPKWAADAVIIGGTGKYTDASGSFTSKGENHGQTASWSEEGTISFASQDQNLAAIKKVISDETSAYLKSDNTKGKSIRTSHYTHLINMPQNEVNLNTYSNGEDVYGPTAINMTNTTRDHWDIQIRGNVAWAIFKQSTDALGSKVPSVETRILEKVNGEWKIAHMQTAIDYENAQPPLKY